METFKADVAIIGAGGAGLRAAIAVAEALAAFEQAVPSVVLADIGLATVGTLLAAMAAATTCGAELAMLMMPRSLARPAAPGSSRAPGSAAALSLAPACLSFAGPAGSARLP